MSRRPTSGVRDLYGVQSNSMRSSESRLRPNGDRATAPEVSLWKAVRVGDCSGPKPMDMRSCRGHGDTALGKGFTPACSRHRNELSYGGTTTSAMMNDFLAQVGLNGPRGLGH